MADSGALPTSGVASSTIIERFSQVNSEYGSESIEYCGNSPFIGRSDRHDARWSIRTAHFRWAPSCEMRLTSRIHANQFLPVTDGNTPTVSDSQRGEEGSLTSRKKMGLVERQRSLLARSGPHRIAIHEGEHEERIEAQVDSLPSSTGLRTSRS